MGLKKIFPVLLVLINSMAVYAGNGFLPDKIENIFVYLFSTLPSGVLSQDLVAIVFFKFLLFIFVFAVVFSSLKKVMHDNARVAMASALVISLTSVMMISNSIIVKIFKAYSFLITALIVVLPLLLIFFLGKKLFPNVGVKSSWAKGLLFVAAAMIVLFMSVSLMEAGNNQIYEQLGRWMEVAAVILLFVGMIMFFEGAGSMVKGNYSGGTGGGSSAPKIKKNAEKDLEKDEKTERERERVMRKLRRITKGEVHDLNKVIRNLQRIRGMISLAKDFKRKGGREAFSEKLKEIQHEEQDFQEKFSPIKKSEDELMDLFRRQLHLEIRDEVVAFVRKISENFNEILQLERTFSDKYSELIRALESRTKRSYLKKIIDELIEIKIRQKKSVQHMLKAEKVINYLERRDLVQGINKMRELLGKDSEGPPEFT
ncbi:hypothetical protein GF323_02095 [Candidatus Woesearchaeota archaeon]|nr:hypothetical protein [Candidatus Woesearchaeota archaeon]